MKRNPLIPFALIAVLGIALMVLFSFKGLGDMDEIAKENKGGTEEVTTENTASGSAEDLYKKSCIGCHGDQYQGGVGPKLTGVGERLSADQIKDVLVNGRGAMPPGLAAGQEDAMATWLSELK